MNAINLIKDLLESDTKKAILPRTVFLIIVICVFWFYIFVFPYLNTINSNLGIKEDFILYGIIGWFSLMIYTIIVNTDVLSNPESKSKYAKAFQKTWPSNYIKEKFNIDNDTANYIWFEKCFIEEKVQNNRNSQYSRTLERGYQCRLIFYTQKVLKIFWILSLVQFTIELFFIKFPMIENNFWKCIFIIIMFSSYLVLYLCNRVKKDGSLSGVWKRYEEINKIHIKWIDENVDFINQEINKLPQ